MSDAATCPVCRGSGWDESRADPWKSKPCPTCKGTGDAASRFFTDRCMAMIDTRGPAAGGPDLTPCGLPNGHEGPHEPVKLGAQFAGDELPAGGGGADEPAAVPEPAPVNSAARRYLVVADGAGEYDHDFSIVWCDAETPWGAAEWAVAPEQGYGRRDGGRVFVINAEHVHSFSTAERTVVELTKTEAVDADA